MKRSVAALAVLLVIALARAALPQPARTGEWAVSGSLERPRAYATTVLLPNGSILVVGGMDQNDPQIVASSTEVIDSATGSVTTLKDRVTGRLWQTATLTSRGKVVIAGGVEWHGRFGSTDRVDIFDPFSKSYASAAPLQQARSDHGAAALPDGKILVTGGNFNNRPLASSEIYDPETNTWRWAAPLSHPRVRFTIAALRDGRILIAGGLDEKGHPESSSEIYDPRRDRWMPGPSLSVGRVQHATVVLPDGDILLIGGQFGASGTAERYDQTTSEFVYAGTLVVPRLVEQAGLLPDGRVLVTGGSIEKPGRTEWVPFPDAEVWDPATNTWSIFPSPATPRAHGEMVSTPFGLYLISGIGPDQAPHRTIEKLTLK